MALNYLLDPLFQIENSAGKPATGGWLEVYIHGTRTKYYCASDFDGTLHPFKIPLDSLGSNIVLADDGQAYDVYAYNRYGSQLMSRYNVKPGSGSGSEPVVIDDRPISRIEVISNTLDGPDWINNSWKYSLDSIEGDKLAWRQVGGDLNFGEVYAQAGTYHYDFIVKVDWHGEPRNEIKRFQILGINTIDRDTWISFDLSYQHSEFYHFGSMVTRPEGYEDRVFSTLQIAPYDEAPAGLTATVQTLTIYSLDDAKTIVTEGTPGIDKVYHDNTMTGDGTFVNPLRVSTLGRVHFLKAVFDDQADVRAPYGYWIVDLEKPDAFSPYGYDYATASEVIAKLSAGEIFVLSTYDSAPSSDEDVFTMCKATDQSEVGHTAVRIDFTRMFAGGAEYMYYTAIYTPSMHNNDLNNYPEERLAIFNVHGDQSPLSQFEFMPYTSLATVATTGNYNDLTNKPDLALKEDVANKSQTVDASSTTEYPSSKAAADFVTNSIADVKTTTVRQNGQADNSKCPTEAAVRTAIDSAVSSAYHAAGTKTVAQLTSSLLVSANEGDVYNITDSGVTTSDFIEGAGLPIRVGDNVVVCNVGGGVYKFDLLSGFVDLTNYLTKTGDGSDVTASFTAASTRTNVTTGEKLSVLFGKIAKWFSDLKALAFKDKVNTNDIDDDAVTADKVKDNETLPVNVTGYASHLRQAKCKFLDSETGYRLMAYLPPSINNYADTCYIFNIYETRDQYELTSGILKGVLSIRIRRDKTLYRYSSAYKGCSIDYIGLDLRVDPSTHGINLYATKSGQIYAFTVFELLNDYDQYGAALNPTLHVESELLGSVSGTVVTPTFTLLKGSGGTIPLANNNGVGSATEPVYVSSTGEVLQCTPSSMSVGSASFATLADTGVKLPTAWGAFDVQTGYRLLATLTAPGAWNDRICTFNVFETRDGMSEPYGQLGTLTVQIRNNNGPVGYGASYCGMPLQNIDIVVMSNSDQSMSIYAYSSGNVYGGLQLALASSSGYTGNPTGREGLTLYLNNSIQATVTGSAVTIYKTRMWDYVKSKIVEDTVNVNQVDTNTETSSFTFVNGHVYHLTLQLEGSPLVTNSTSSGTGYVVAYIGSSMTQSHYSCRQLVDIQNGELTTKDIKFPVDWKAENITGSSDNQLHIEVRLNGSKYYFIQNNYELILMGTDFSGT